MGFASAFALRATADKSLYPSYALSTSWRAQRSVTTSKTIVARLDRAIQYAAASELISNVSGILGRPVKPGDDSQRSTTT